jgi:hypothetical protein
VDFKNLPEGVFADGNNLPDFVYRPSRLPHAYYRGVIGCPLLANCVNKPLHVLPAFTAELSPSSLTANVARLGLLQIQKALIRRSRSPNKGFESTLDGGINLVSIRDDAVTAQT